MRVPRTGGLNVFGEPKPPFRFRRPAEEPWRANFRAGCGKCVCLIVRSHEQFCFCGLVRIGGVDAVHVGPNDKLVGIDHVRHQPPEKSELFLPSVVTRPSRSRADESGYDGNEAIIEERKKNFPTRRRVRQFAGAHRGTCHKSNNSEELTGTGRPPVFSEPQRRGAR